MKLTRELRITDLIDLSEEELEAIISEEKVPLIEGETPRLYLLSIENVLRFIRTQSHCDEYLITAEKVSDSYKRNDWNIPDINITDSGIYVLKKKIIDNLGSIGGSLHSEAGTITYQRGHRGLSILTKMFSYLVGDKEEKEEDEDGTYFETLRLRITTPLRLKDEILPCCNIAVYREKIHWSTPELERKDHLVGAFFKNINLRKTNLESAIPTEAFLSDKYKIIR